jgi:hypothetical protein
MKHFIEIGPGAMIYTPSLIKIVAGIQVHWGGVYIYGNVKNQNCIQFETCNHYNRSCVDQNLIRQN